MAKLTTKTRKEIPTGEFAGPKRSYPIEDKAHARNALARSSGKAVHAEVAAKVEKKYPDIRVDGAGYVHKVTHRNHGKK